MQDPARFVGRIGKFAMIPIGFLLLIGAVYSVWSTQTWLSRTAEVEGTVIEMVRSRDRDDTSDMFSPKVRFETVEGRRIEFQSNWRTNPPAYRKNQTVTVVYDRDEPQSAAIRGFLSLWMLPMILTFIGSIFFAIGTTMVVLSNKVTRGFHKPMATI